jgi:hypothetical protein
VRNSQAVVKSTVSGHLIQYLETQQIQMRANPSDLDQGGNPTDEVVMNYNSAQRAIHEVRLSVQRFVIMNEDNRAVDLRGNSIQGRLSADAPIPPAGGSPQNASG